MSDKKPENPLARAIAARRPEPARGYEERLRAAANRPRRSSFAIPAAIGLAAAVATIVIVVGLSSRRSVPPAATPIAVTIDGWKPPEPTTPEPTLPAGPGTTTVDTLAAIERYQGVLDGNVASLGLDATQRAKIEAIADDLGKQTAQRTAEREVAMIDLRRELGRTDIDATKATTALDRMSAADAAIRRAAMVATINARAVLTVAQRALVEKGPVRVTTAPPPKQPTTPTAPSGMGVLKLATKPPCEIYVDGASTGLKTPATGIKLAAGKHKVTLVNSEHSIKETFIVEIKPGEQTSILKDYSDRMRRSDDDVVDPFTTRGNPYK